MACRHKDPFCTLTAEEQAWLARLSRALSELARHVLRATPRWG